MAMFKKATRTQGRLRAALVGPSGSGKTYTALRLARGIAEVVKKQGGKGRIALIDSERGSAAKYAGIFDFDSMDLETFSPKQYVEAIQGAEAEGYDVLIIDSLSHAWAGKDGALELVDQAKARSKAKDGFGAWREVTPLHNQLVDTILRSRCHVIATMRVKTEYVVEENEQGKKTPRKVGLAPVQRDGVEYEFDLVADLEDAKLAVTKSRVPGYAKKVIQEPGEELGSALATWLLDAPPPNAATDPVLRKQFGALWQRAKGHGYGEADFKKLVAQALGAEKTSADIGAADLAKVEEELKRQTEPPPSATEQGEAAPV